MNSPTCKQNAPGYPACVRQGRELNPKFPMLPNSILLAGQAFLHQTVCGECFYLLSRDGFQEPLFAAVFSSLFPYPGTMLS